MTRAPTRLALHDAPALPADPRPGTRALDDTALGALGIDLLVASATRTVLRMPAPTARDRGLLLVLAESAASTGAGLAAGPDARAFGAELNAHFLADPTPGTVIAIAEPLLVEPTRQVWHVRAFDGRDALLLDGRCTLGVVAAVPRPAS
jgi:acyl-coenzyme A thioesterase PaaI-like protein